MDLLQQHEEQVVYRTGVETPVAPSKSDPDRISGPTSEPAILITNGLCINCDNLGDCVWQHNHKLNCQHYH